MAKKKNKVLTEENFKIKFDGKLHEVDVNTFLVTLTSINEVIQEINGEINVGNHSENRVSIKVKAIQKGSFEVYLDIIQNLGETLLSGNNVNYAAGVLTVLTGLLSLKQFLKSKKPKKVEKKGDKSLKITNQKGDTFIIENLTYNLYEKSEKAQTSISRTFSTLSNDQNVTGLEIRDKKDKELFKAKKEEFKELSEFIQPGNTEDKKIVIEFTRLTVFKVVFEHKYKWDFYYKGTKIGVKITDKDFFEKINKGETFSKGDILEVDLQINQEYDKTLNIFVNKTYEVNKVHRHIPRNEQLDMF